ncbi:MAG: DUF1569 domain-containing protein [Bryobacteraceae bacterium]
MKSLRDPGVAQELAERMARLRPGSRSLWGRMNAHQMLCHLNDSFLLAMGEKAASADTNFLKRTLVKRIALWLPMPWPHGVPTRPEMDQLQGGTPPVAFEHDAAGLRRSIERFAAMSGGFAEHPIFGAMTVHEWQRWGWLHCDHHFRQFGI